MRKGLWSVAGVCVCMYACEGEMSRIGPGVNGYFLCFQGGTLFVREFTVSLLWDQMKFLGGWGWTIF